MANVKLTAKMKKALNKIPSYSELLAAHDFGDCVEFIVNRWGDTCTYRVYNDGSVCEK